MAAERTILFVAALLATACPHDDIDTTDSTQTLSPESTMTASQEDSSSSTSDPTIDPTNAATSTTATSSAEESSSTGADASGCSLASPCEVGYCVAPYADNDRGEFTCVPDCVMAGDETSWCFDDAACCDPEATCTERGYCISPDDTSSTG